VIDDQTCLERSDPEACHHCLAVATPGSPSIIGLSAVRAHRTTARAAAAAGQIGRDGSTLPLQKSSGCADRVSIDGQPHHGEQGRPCVGLLLP
jgi:hypothetical protein